MDLHKHYENYLFFQELKRMHEQMPAIVQKNVEDKLSESTLRLLKE